MKADIDYETWRHEVVSAAEGNVQEAIREAMLQSLKGKAADVAQFSASYNMADTLAVLDATLGNVAPAPVLMKELHSESWIQGEAMSDYGTRLMDQMQRISCLYPKEISEEETPTLLQDHFYHGLLDHYWSTLHYLYNQQPTYEMLFRAVQELESELAATKSVKVAKAAKVKVQGVDAQAKSALVGVIAEDSGTSRKKKKKKGGISQEDSVRGGGSMHPRGQARGASGAPESNNNNN